MFLGSNISVGNRAIWAAVGVGGPSEISASDDFNQADGVFNTTRWTDAYGINSVSILNNKLRTSSASGSVGVDNNATLPADSWFASHELLTNDIAAPGSGNYQAALVLFFASGRNVVCRFTNTQGIGERWDILDTVGGELHTEAASLPFSGSQSMEVIQNGSNIDVKFYRDGSLKHTLSNINETPTKVRLNGNNAAGANTWIVDNDNFELKNGTLASPGSSLTIPL